jgi:hypothetical protein
MTQTEAQQIKDLLEQRMGSIQNDLDEIKAQTVLTNGRVKELELRQERQKGWLQVLGMFVPVLTAVVIWVVVEKVLV